MALNQQKELFCEEYVVDFNATQAAVRAGYSELSAHTIGWELLQKPDIKLRIQTLLDLTTERTRVTRDKIIRELARIAFSNPSEVVDFGFNGVELKESLFLDRDSMASIREVTEKRTSTGLSVSIKFHDKIKALELLGKHMNMFIDKLDVRAVVSNVEPGAGDRAALEHFIKHYAVNKALPEPARLLESAENYDDLV